MLAIAYVEVTIKVAMKVQPRQAAYHHRLYGDCYDVDSRDDCGVDVHRGQVVRVMNCKFDSDSACHHPMNVAMT